MRAIDGVAEVAKSQLVGHPLLRPPWARVDHKKVETPHVSLVIPPMS